MSFTSYHEFKKRYDIRPGDASTWLGSGSYGRVYKVQDEVDTDWVAIKMSEYNEHERKSLLQEVELAKSLPRNANLARYDACYRLETEMGVYDFAVMKYYPDGNLSDLLQTSFPLPDTLLKRIVFGILDGLEHLHNNHIIHRDLKPANILIARDGRGQYVPKIADFGLSKMVSTSDSENSDFEMSDVRGTPSYKAPEQILNTRVNYNLDLWAFGVVLYELLTKEKIFSGPGSSSSQSSVGEVEQRIVNVTLPEKLSTVPEPYQQAIRMCLVKDIRSRVKSATELREVLSKEPVAAAAPASQIKQTRENAFAPEANQADASPRSQKTRSEVTDVYQEAHLRTDVFQPVSEKAIQPPRPARPPEPTKPSVPLWAILGGILVIGGIAWGIFGNRKSEPTANRQGIAEVDTVATIPQPPPRVASTPITLPDKQKPEPTERPVIKSISKGVEVNTGNVPAPSPVEDNTAALQSSYDTFVANGLAAFKRNDREEASQYFTKAVGLVQREGGRINTAKGQEAYRHCFEMANRQFEAENYEGAINRFKVARIINNTKEVNDKIKICNASL